MSSVQARINQTTRQLSHDFLINFPLKGARYLESIDPDEAAEVLAQHSATVIRKVWQYLPAGTSDQILICLPSEVAANVLGLLDSHVSAALLERIEESVREKLVSAIAPDLRAELEELSRYPHDSAARLMSRNVHAFHQEMRASQALYALKNRDVNQLDMIYVLDSEQRLIGEIDLATMLKASPDDTLGEIKQPLKATLNALDAIEDVTDKFEGMRCVALPVLDIHQQLIGSIRFTDIYQSTKEDLVSDMQTMVGASKDERALSSSWFAVRKRMPWLQINLLTAFAAAGVVGSFEGLIAEITALAILLPVAAGQSGNAGAQALAVTMRGLTLREITIRHWPRVLFKEMATGLLNGIAIAITCSIAVYVWSQSVGLALVIALAMVSSLVIACSAGAVVPIALKRFGLDPAQSSSIVLTTITDIAGFMSFLGIALMLSDMLPRG